MEIFWKDLPLVEEEELLVKEDEKVLMQGKVNALVNEGEQALGKEKEPTSIIPAFESFMNERAELFQALIERVTEHEISYIERHSWLFGR